MSKADPSASSKGGKGKAPETLKYPPSTSDDMIKSVKIKGGGEPATKGQNDVELEPQQLYFDLEEIELEQRKLDLEQRKLDLEQRKLDLEQRKLKLDLEEIELAKAKKRLELTKCFSHLKEILSRGQAIAIAVDMFQDKGSTMSGNEFEEIYHCSNRRDACDKLLKFVLRSNHETHDLFRRSLHRHDHKQAKFLEATTLSHQELEDSRGLRPYTGFEIVKNLTSDDQSLLEIELNGHDDVDYIIDHLLSNNFITIDDHDYVRNGTEANITHRLIRVLQNRQDGFGPAFVDMLISLGRKNLVENLSSPVFRISRKPAETCDKVGCSPVRITFHSESPFLESKLRSFFRSESGQEVITNALSKEGDLSVQRVEDGSVIICLKSSNKEANLRIAQMSNDGTINQFLEESLRNSEALLDIPLELENIQISHTYSELETPSTDGNQVQVNISGEQDARPIDITLDIDVKRKTIREVIGEVSYLPEDVLGYGVHRSVVFKGTVCAGKHIAVKRLRRFDDRETDFYATHQRMLYIKHPNLVVYIDVVRKTIHETNEEYIFVVMELCSGNMQKWMSTSFPSTSHGVPVSVLMQIASGLSYLHSRSTVHGALTLSRIFFQTDVPQNGIKIGGFTKTRTLTELPQNDGDRLMQLDDIKSLGEIFKDFEAKMQNTSATNDHQIASEAQLYIPQRKVELQQLLVCMLDIDPAERPTAEEVLAHPFFWSDAKTVEFLEVAYIDRQSHVDLDDTEGKDIAENWTAKLTPNLQWEILNGHRGRRSAPYDATKVSEILRAIRNFHVHGNECNLDVQAEIMAGSYVQYWTSKFPRLVMYVYKKLKNYRHTTKFQRFYSCETH